MATPEDLELLPANPSGVRAWLAWDESRCAAGGVLHGGALMSLADSAAAGTTTVESKTNFLRGVREGSVTASSTPLHKGRRFEDRLVAKVTQTQAVL